MDRHGVLTTHTFPDSGGLFQDVPQAIAIDCDAE